MSDSDPHFVQDLAFTKYSIRYSRPEGERGGWEVCEGNIILLLNIELNVEGSDTTMYNTFGNDGLPVQMK